jgi:hypothetical protein
MRYVRELAQGQVADGPQAPASGEFARIRQAGRLEVVQRWFDYECYDRALFEALQQLRAQPQQPYLRHMVVLSLYKLHRHMEKHTFAAVVANVTPRNPEAFNLLLRNLHALSLGDFQGLAACFAQQAPPAAPAADEYALAARYAAAVLAHDPNPAALQRQYQQQYKGGRFDAVLFPLPKTASRAR